MTSESGERSLDEIFTQGIERGAVRTNLTCEEARREWFLMARNMYVDKNPPRYPQDAEVGLHLAACETAPCMALAIAYEQFIRMPQSRDSAKARIFIDTVEERLRQLPEEMNY